MLSITQKQMPPPANRHEPNKNDLNFQETTDGKQVETSCQNELKEYKSQEGIIDFSFSFGIGLEMLGWISSS